MEDGTSTECEEGTPQGATVSPLLANVYLHYVLNLWAQQWRRRKARGDVILTRFADDFVVGFQHRSDAEQFLRELKERLRQFSLELHPEKTRLIEFGRFAAHHRRRARQGHLRRSTSWGSRTCAGPRRAGNFRSCDGRCKSG